MTEPQQSRVCAARVAGATYLITFVAVLFANFAVHERLNVAGDAVQTARNLLANERLFRIAVLCDLAYATGLLIIVAAFYVILAPVGRGLALFAALGRVMYATMWVLMSLHSLAALRHLGSAVYLQAVGTAPLQSLAKLTLAFRADDYYVGLVFYGLGSAAFSWLWWKSAFIPRPLSIAGVVVYAWCAFCAAAYIVDPAFAKLVNLWWFDTPMGVVELATAIWLLIQRPR